MDEMPLKRRGAKQNSANHLAPRIPLDHSKATQTEMVRGTVHGNGHSTRKVRQTEKEMGGQRPGMNWLDTGRRHEEG